MRQRTIERDNCHEKLPPRVRFDLTFLANNLQPHLWFVVDNFAGEERARDRGPRRERTSYS